MAGQHQKTQKRKNLLTALVLAVFLVLVPLLVVGVHATYFKPSMTEAEVAVLRTKIRLNEAAEALMEYANDCQTLPSADSGFQALNEPPGDHVCMDWHGPYSPKTENSGWKDEWGHDLVYEPKPEASFTITSLGADGRPGGEGDAADLTLDPLDEFRD